MAIHDRAIAAAQKLLAKHGRSVTLVEQDTTMADTDMPWLGATDPNAAPTSTLVTNAVAVPPASREKFGLTVSEDAVSRVDQILMISPGESVDIETYQVVIDGTRRFGIMWSEVFRPGTQLVLAFLGVKR